MKFTIKKGRHRPGNWWKCIRIWCNKKSLSYRVTFDFTANYDLQGPDNDDVNKLFGFGYFWNLHKESARFGWNYNLQTGKVNLFAYTYVNGQRSFTKLCEISRTYLYDLTLIELPDRYVFDVKDGRTGLPITLTINSVSKLHHKKWSYHLGLYFGGNQKAPHSITVEMTKK